MRSFKYSHTKTNESIEEVIGFRRKTVMRQQIVFTTILSVIVVLTVLYILRSFSVTMLDGYVKVAEKHMRAFDDIRIEQINVTAGSLIVPGDTLYSFYYCDPFLRFDDKTQEPQILTLYKQTKLQYGTLSGEIELLQVKKRELQKQIELEKKNVSLGLISNSTVLNLERELKLTIAEIQQKLKTLKLLKERQDELYYAVGHSLSSDAKIDVDNADYYKSNVQLKNVIHYAISKDTCIVTNVYVNDFSFRLKGEPIADAQPLGVTAPPLEVFAYVPTKRLHRFNFDSKVEVILSSDWSLYGEFELLGVRLEELPVNLRSNFTREVMVNIAKVHLFDGQSVPLWAASDGFPVLVKFSTHPWTSKKKFNAFDHSRLRFRTNSGLEEESLEIFDSIRSLPSNRLHSDTGGGR